MAGVWESTGLVTDPERTPSGYRDYKPEVVDRLRFIRHAQTAGLTLAEIRQVLAISDGGEPAPLRSLPGQNVVTDM